MHGEEEGCDRSGDDYFSIKIRGLLNRRTDGRVNASIPAGEISRRVCPVGRPSLEFCARTRSRHKEVKSEAVQRIDEVDLANEWANFVAMDSGTAEHR